MKTFGVLLFIGAVLVGGYALLVFDPSVATAYGSRVNNIGLMQDRQNLLLAACAAAVVGTILMVFGGRGGASSTPASPYGGGPGPVPSQRMERPEFDSARLVAVEDFRDALKHDDATAVQKALQDGRVRAYDELATGRGFLQFAVTAGALKCIPLLLEAGAKPDHRDSTGRTAVDFVTASSSPELQRLLRSKAQSASNAVVRDAPAKMMMHLEQLASLRADGVLTGDEFEVAKARVLQADQEARPSQCRGGCG